MAYFPTRAESRLRDGWLPDDPEGDEAIGLAIERHRPHIFIRKRWRRWGAGRRISQGNARDITLAEFESAYAAADFALHAGLPLDVHVTINFASLGISAPEDVQAEIIRFLKCYGAYARGKFPAAWLYSVEMGRDGEGLGYHVHFAMYVPGVTPETEDAPPRRAFRKWAAEYVDSIRDRHVPRAIKVSCSLRARPLAHWLTVTYLLKGCDQHALVQSARISPEGLPVFLRDLMPWPYADPGPVATSRRVAASHSLGPKRREIGAPDGMEHILPQKPDLRLIRVDGNYPPNEVGQPLPTVHEPVPFRSAFEDGARDVRVLYSHELYRLVTRRDPFPPPEPVDGGERECLTCQLHAIADAQQAHAWKCNVYRGLTGYGED